ncbi:MAG: L-aspartate oxidase [Acidimicrobiales bacterium]
MSLPSPRFLPSTSASWHVEADLVVVGTGAAGLSAALTAARTGRHVVVLAKGELTSGSTPLAQGGLAVVTDPADSFASHASDTLVAGAGLGDGARVNELVTEAPSVVDVLERLGARFDDGVLGLEGGHSHRRIVHAGGDAIGEELHRVLKAAVRRVDVNVMENTVAIDLVLDDSGRVAGLAAGRVGPTGSLSVGVISSPAVVLATGGYGQAFASTTNPAEVTGDGLAMAARAGAELMNVEFVQFHPTVLYVEGQRGQSPLITEALRGAGAVIIDDDGRPVMRGVHPLCDLAPRDVVAHAMVRHTLANPSTSHLWLDARDIGAARLDAEFPTTVSICRSLGVEPSTDPIPIAPGAHYACGGVRADLDGTTSIPGLFAVGEVAATGVHGANRLASNSLTEACISGRRAGALGGTSRAARSRSTSPAAYVETGRGVDPESRNALAVDMSLYASVLREREGLERVLARLDGTASSGADPLDLATLEATNVHTASMLLATAALLREESRGCHRRTDFDRTDPEWGQPLIMRVIDGEVVAHAGVLARA